MKLYSELESLLKSENNFIDDNGQLKKWVIINKAQNYDEELISLLLEDEEIKAHFFIKIKQVLIFNQSLFIQFLEQKNYLKDSYTSFKNKIGLTIDGKFLKQRNEVALVWPYKDCVLQGGQSREEDKRKEIFFNEILAQDEISQLLEPKVLTNAKRFTTEGEMAFDKFNRNEEGTITDNLIIKGNNLLALHSLKEEFAGKVKLIYIDPPYNTGSDSFGYNDSFNHSTWLTFMRNRLLVAKELLSEDGVIFVQCDDNEQAFLKILMDDVFVQSNYLQTVCIKKATAAGFKSINLCPITTKEYIFIYGKNKNSNVGLNKIYVKTSFVSDYDTYINNIEDNYKEWKFESLNDIFYKSIGVTQWKEAKTLLGINWKLHRQSYISNFARENYNGIISFKDLHKPSKGVKEIMELSKKDREKIFEYSREGENMFFKKGRSITFYRNKIKEINGEFVPSEILSDVWTDIKWDGIANEGNVTMKNGKKPEKLLQRILELSTSDGDIVLDYHLGSGTTASVAQKMNRQYIGIEQMNYIETVAVERLKEVINGEQGGISKSINWKGGDEFIYLELKKHNQNFIDQIQSANDSKRILKIWEEMKTKSFLNYNVDIKKQEEHIEDFKNLNLDEQKLHLVSILDKNQLYVNYSSLKDNDTGLTSEEIKITKDFYQLK